MFEGKLLKNCISLLEKINEMIAYAKLNKGYRYILVVVNAFSKYVSMKRITGKQVAEAMKTILGLIKMTQQICKRTWAKSVIVRNFEN